MVSMLDQIHRGRERGARRTMIYGTEGIGKSTFGAGAPNPIFLPTEDGVRDIDTAKFPRITTYDQALAALADLYEGQHDFKTVVVDTLDALERMIWAEVAKKFRKTSIEEIGYAKGYTFALDYWKGFLEGLDALREKKGMGCVLIAHSQVQRFANPEGDDYDRYAPKLHKLAAGLVQEWADEVFFATYKVYVKVEGEGFRKAGKAVGTGERTLHTAATPAFHAKNRLALPPELPLSWEAYASHFTDKQAKKAKA